MLTTIKLKNFRCFADAEAPLRGLTVLIGKNDTGKSSFLDALAILCGSLPPDPKRDGRLFSPNTVPTIEAYSGGKPVAAWAGNNIRGSGEHRGRTSKYNLPSEGPPMLSEGLSDAQGPPVLGADGGHVPALLDHLLRTDRKRHAEFIESACASIPGLTDIGIRTPHPAMREIELTIEAGIRIPAAWSSVGVRVMLFFLALAHHPQPPRMILIEEPEKGVHPGRLEDIVKLLRGLTDGTRSPEPAQVILATHSPYLLDYIDIERDQVLIFERQDDGRRTIAPADVAGLRLFLDEFRLGEVWLNRGEKGLIAREGP